MRPFIESLVQPLECLVSLAHARLNQRHTVRCDESLF